MVLDPLYIKRPDVVISERFKRHLSLVLSRLPVTASDNPVLALQVGFAPIIEQVLISRPLDLAQQPSPLHVPLGVTKRGDLWLSIIDLDSVMIGGMRRLGKTNLLHTWIQALDHGGEAEVWMWDGKPNNNEFRGYAGRTNIELIGYDQLHRYLADLTAMLEDRSALFARSGVSNLSAYNRTVPAAQAIAPIGVDHRRGRRDQSHAQRRQQPDGDRAADRGRRGIRHLSRHRDAEAHRRRGQDHHQE